MRQGIDCMNAKGNPYEGENAGERTQILNHAKSLELEQFNKNDSATDSFSFSSLFLFHFGADVLLLLL